MVPTGSVSMFQSRTTQSRFEHCTRSPGSSRTARAARAALCVGALLLAVALPGCYFPDRNLQSAREGVLGETEPLPEDDGVDEATRAEIARESGSTIRPGDQIRIDVLQDDELNGTYRIDNDGGFQWHYVGRVKTESLTTSDLRKKLIDVADEYINDPSITVNYTSQQPRSVRVLGYVRDPGPVPLDSEMRIVDALAAAGDLHEEANQQEIVLIRAASPDRIRAGLFNYRDAMLNPLGDAWASNVPLEPGDTVYVPRSGRAQWEAAILFVNRLADTLVGIERSIILYEDAESVLSTGETAGRNTIVVR